MNAIKFSFEAGPVTKTILWVVFGLILGATGALSFLKTDWQNYQIDGFFWWSIVSTLGGGLLLFFSLWQYWDTRSQQEKVRAQVKVWMQDANGLSVALNRLVIDDINGLYTSSKDLRNAVWAVQATAFALYQSLYEERCVTEEEYKARQKRLSEKLEAQQTVIAQ